MGQKDVNNLVKSILKGEDIFGTEENSQSENYSLVQDEPQEANIIPTMALRAMSGFFLLCLVMIGLIIIQQIKQYQN